MLTMARRRENLKRLEASPRRQREITAVAADAVGLSYGPSECAEGDADDRIRVNLPFGDDYTVIIPVQYVLTRNRGILEMQTR